MLRTLVILTTLAYACFGALPKSAWNCDDEKIDSKYYNESCKSDADCFGRSMSMVCKEGMCKCAENYVPEERFVGEAATQVVCVSAPFLFSPCKTICQKPAVCKPYAGDDQKLKDQKVCQCDAPYKLTEGVCHLECKEDEYYDSGKLKCIQKCKANAISVNDTCYPVVGLKEKCEINKQCQQAWSECSKDHVCACLPGFSVQDGSCVPETVNCPNGEVMKDNNVAKKCKVLKREVKKSGAEVGKDDDDDKPQSTFELYDDCPAQTHYCHMIGGSYRNENNTGYCCPKSKPVCPVGRPMEGVQCRTYGKNQCPWDTHYCHAIGNAGEEVCCPKHCDSNMILDEGKCFGRARLGDSCMNSRQCTDTYTDCVNGKCQCSDGATEVKSATYKYCSHKCKEGEILHDKKCYSAFSLGDSCKAEKWRCPTNAICNKVNVCSCSCPRFTLSKDVCAPLPVCPGPRRFIAYRAMSLSADSEPKGYTPISDSKRHELLSNITFCSIKDKKSSATVETVEKCPEGQYCATYISNLGICCKKHEPVCPNGKKPASIGKCDPRNPLSCGVNKLCFEYLYTADPNSDDGRICCDQVDEDED